MNTTKIISFLNNVAISNELNVRFRREELHLGENKCLYLILMTDSNIRVTFVADFNIKGLCYTLQYIKAYLWSEEWKDVNPSIILDTTRALQLAIGNGLSIGMEELSRS